MKLTLEFEFDEETPRVMVFCRELGVATSGKDVPEAFEMIGDACAVYLRTLEDLGELEERVLKVAGRIDTDSEEIEQDIADAVEALRDYKPGKVISFGTPRENGKGNYELD